MTTLTLVEMRKTVDTRSGRWLLGIIGLLSAAIVAVLLIWGETAEDTSFRTIFTLALLPTGFLLPVLGILAVTSEWSQRTAMTTFTLVPARHRVVTAKFAAAVLFGLLALAVAALVAAAGHGLAIVVDGAPADWSLPAAALGQAALLEVLGVVGGIAFGMLFLNSPLAIVSYFLLPTLWSVLVELVPSVAGAATWLDLNLATEPLLEGRLSGEQWGHLGTSAAAWILLPAVAGAVRMLRGEVK